MALADGAELNATRSRATAPDDDFLYAVLSFAALTSRGTVVRFVRDGLAPMTDSRAALLKRQLLQLFHRSLFGRRSQQYERYQPTDLAVTGRHAAWSANLALLAVVAGGEVTADELFPDSDDGVSWWRQICLLWHSQLTPGGWNGMVHGLDVIRDWDGPRRLLRVRMASGDPVPALDLRWSPAQLFPRRPGRRPVRPRRRVLRRCHGFMGRHSACPARRNRDHSGPRHRRRAAQHALTAWKPRTGGVSPSPRRASRTLRTVTPGRGATTTACCCV